MTSKELPPLSPQDGVTINTLMDLSYKQLWSFTEFLNDSLGKVETWKYFDYVLYAHRKRFKEEASEKGWKFKKHPEDDEI